MNGKCAYRVTIPFLLAVPGLVWITLDRGMWRGDPCGYALSSLWLYLIMVTNLPLWKWNLFHYYKAPLILWLGQLFVPVGAFTGSMDFSLLLIPFISTFSTLILLFRSFELLFKNKAIVFCGCVAVAASPLFNGLSTQFWIEPLQTAIVSWFIYAMMKASKWNFYFALSQFVIALSFGMLVKVSTPLYIIGPAVLFWITVFRSSPSMKMDKKNILFLLAALFIFFQTFTFYFNNFQALHDFAHYAATSPLFASDASKYCLWKQFMREGVSMKLAFCLSILLLLWGIIKTIKLRTYGNFGSAFIVAFFQIVVFFIAWMVTANVDPRYFLPIVPYFAILVCWGLASVNNWLCTAISVCVFFIQFIYVNGYAFGFIQSKPPYGEIRPLERQPGRNLRILHDLMPLTTRDSSIIFDLNPQLGVAEFQYELAKKDLTGNWQSCCVDIGAFFNINLQVIDTAKINVETVWKNVLDYHPDFYITWNSRLSPAQAEAEMKKIDKYNAVTVPVRWTIADRMKNCDLYEEVSFSSYPDLLVYRRCNLHRKAF